jgi:hypothetical protein
MKEEAPCPLQVGSKFAVTARKFAVTLKKSLFRGAGNLTIRY